MSELQPGECLLENCAGGKCLVCGEQIQPGPAVQLSKWVNNIRHTVCLSPDPEARKGGARKRTANKLNSNLTPKKYTHPLKGNKKRGATFYE